MCMVSMTASQRQQRLFCVNRTRTANVAFIPEEAVRTMTLQVTCLYFVLSFVCTLSAHSVTALCHHFAYLYFQNVLTTRNETVYVVACRCVMESSTGEHAGRHGVQISALGHYRSNDVHKKQSAEPVMNKPYLVQQIANGLSARQTMLATPTIVLKVHY
jgi:hypothetical protein